MTRKPAARISQKRGTVFLAEITPGTLVLGAFQIPGCVSFFNVFVSDPQAEIDLEGNLPVLFTAAVWKGFFSTARIWVVDRDRTDILERFSPPDLVIRMRGAGAPGDKPGWDGKFPYAGGDLYRIPNPLTPDTSSNGTLVKAALDCQKDRDAITRYELSGMQTTFPLLERLAACHLSGGNADPLKAKVFDGCDYLKNEHVIQTSPFLGDRMPLLGLRLVDGKWVP